MSIVAAVYHKNIFYSTAAVPSLGIVAYEAHSAYGGKLNIILSKLLEFYAVNLFVISGQMERVFEDTRQRLSTRPISVKEIDARVVDIISSPETLD